MKIKVSLFNSRLIKDYLAAVSVLSAFSAFITIAIDLPHNIVVVMVVAGVLGTIFVYMWVKANLQKTARLKFNNSILEVKVGDIFKESGLRVIPFNEFFDTLVDESVISSNTLNGKFLKYFANPADIDDVVTNDPRLVKRIIEKDIVRSAGKSTKYEIGTLCPFGEYLLLAFSKFDEDHRAHLSMREYITCLLNFWNQVDIIYSGRSVAIPLMGSGITRLDNYNAITEQELLEIIIWSFKVSRVKFTYPSKVSIIIHESIIDKINFYKLEEC